VEILIKLLRGKYNKGSIIKALGNIGNSQAVESLESLLRRKDIADCTKREVVKALKKITGKEYKIKR
jgi:hypothetical protein